MDIEQKYVLDVYDNIAEHFSDTRFCIWDFVRDFLDNKKPSEKGLEIGCGNGKNLCLNKQLDIVGIDTCQAFVDICLLKNLKVSNQNCCFLQFKDLTFDYVLSIAVFHHLASRIRRYKALKEMIRVLKFGGKGIFSVWGVDQINRKNNMKMRTFVPGDNYVAWTRKSDSKIFKRYYHIFNKDMIMKFVGNFRGKIIINKIFNVRGNWAVQFTKNK